MNFYKEKPAATLSTKRTMQAARGTISDRNGEPLAVDLMHYSLAANRRNWWKNVLLREDFKIINESYDDVYSKINNKNRLFTGYIV